MVYKHMHFQFCFSAHTRFRNFLASNLTILAYVGFDFRGTFSWTSSAGTFNRNFIILIYFTLVNSRHLPMQIQNALFGAVAFNLIFLLHSELPRCQIND